MAEYTELKPLSFGTPPASINYQSGWSQNTSSMSAPPRKLSAYDLPQFQRDYAYKKTSYSPRSSDIPPDFPDEILEPPRPKKPPTPVKVWEPKEDEEIYEPVEENITARPLFFNRQGQTVKQEQEIKGRVARTSRGGGGASGRRNYEQRKNATLPYNLVPGIVFRNARRALPVSQIYVFVSEHLPGIAVDGVNWQKSIRSHLCTCSHYSNLEKAGGETKARWTFTSDREMRRFDEALYAWMAKNPNVDLYGAHSRTDWQELVAGRKPFNVPEPPRRKRPRDDMVTLGLQYDQPENRTTRISRERRLPAMPYLLSVPQNGQGTPVRRRGRPRKVQPVEHQAPIDAAYQDPMLQDPMMMMMDGYNMMENYPPQDQLQYDQQYYEEQMMPQQAYDQMNCPSDNPQGFDQTNCLNDNPQGFDQTNCPSDNPQAFDQTDCPSDNPQGFDQTNSPDDTALYLPFADGAFW